MNRLQKAAIVADLTKRLRERGSWCGETHLQKAVYFLQEMLHVPTAFDFTLYRHGPFSFDLRDEITALRADGVLALEPQPDPYGPKLVVTDGADRLERMFPKTLKKYKNDLEKVANTLSNKGVADLEKLATALYVTREELPNGSLRARAQRLCELKPHVSEDAAEESIIFVDRLLKRVAK